ncbi:MAG: immune inhibitor A [Actinobacteria bacterium]|nr:immune inhibitor A [Actinomycetota bacterium]
MTRSKSRTIALLISIFAVFVVSAVAPAHGAGRVIRIGGYSFFKYPTPSCTGAAIGIGTFAGFTADSCALVDFVADGGGATVDGAAPPLDPVPAFRVTFTDQTGKVVHAEDAQPPTSNSSFADQFSFLINPADWDDPAPGNITFTVTPKTSGDQLRGQTSFQLQLNQLGTRTILSAPAYATSGGLPAEDLVVEGATWEKFNKARTIASDPTDEQPNPDLVPAGVTVVLTKKDSSTVTKSTTATSTGLFTVAFTKAEIGDVSSTAADNFQTVLRIRSTASYTDPATGLWETAVTDTERDAYALFETKPDRAQVRSSFVSERGWVGPGEEYVHAVEYRNASVTPAAGVTITDVLPGGAVYVSATPAPDSVSGNTLTWTIGAVATGTDWPAGASAANRILVTARAKTSSQNPHIVYQDLSDTATLEQTGFVDSTSTSHGPKVSTLDTARYGDRPFPVVLVEYTDQNHSPAATGWTFYNRISNPRNPASLFAHYQHMSYTQLYPHGEVASFDASANDFSNGPFKWSNPYLKGDTCTGVTTVPPVPDPTAPYSEFTPAGARINEGWYTLPGTRNYYGQDGGGSALAPVGDIDSGCGPTGKSAYDAASIADPDLDYNEFDSDRNCVVDFFEVVFQGRGGNGDSQTHGYDNIWPHSGNLQDTYIDATGQAGYVSNDQCRDRLERPLWWTDTTRSSKTTQNKGDALRVFSRIGPYNVNPENGTTSVFAHEYGHSLGLPDFYSNNSAGRETADYWELMAQDAFQYMSVFSRQDLGWIIPKRVPAALTATLKESKVDTHRIDAVTPSGTPYVLAGSDVHNGDAYYVELPHRVLISSVPSGKYAWYSTAGNGFGCPGRTLDVPLRNTKLAESGTALTLTFKSWYEIEWDFDYGFVMISTDGGKTYHSLESQNGTTTPQAFNPNANACQQTVGNGITGTSSSTNFPSNLADRQGPAAGYPAPTFIDDSFDISECAGQNCVLRFAYSTDTGVAKRGWVMDDLKVQGSDGKTYFSDDVEQPRLGSYVPGGWLRFPKGPSPFDHGYYIELRDRVSNDFDSAGQGERHPITWIPGVSLWYTNEANGYGNIGNNDPFGQNPLDPRAEPGEIAPRLLDASFYPLSGLNTFDDTAWTDSYLDENGESFKLTFDCFHMRVNSISNLGSEGDETASLTMATSPSKCLRVLAIRQGRPKGKPLPPTGDDGSPYLFGALFLALAGGLVRRLRATAR